MQALKAGKDWIPAFAGMTLGQGGKDTGAMWELDVMQGRKSYTLSYGEVSEKSVIPA